MESVFLILTVGILMLAAFYAGFSLGRPRGESAKAPAPGLNPLDVFRKSESKKELKQKEKELTTILQNIENYDGSSAGQKDVGR